MKTTKNTITRKKFFNVCGSVVAGGSIAGVSAVLLSRAANERDNTGKEHERQSGVNNTPSPYRLVASFDLPDEISGFELCANMLVAALQNSIALYDLAGKNAGSFAIDANPRNIAVNNSLIYVLYPKSVAVYNIVGERLRYWEACSDQSDYCSIAVSDDAVFVTDAASKNICKYTAEGEFVKFINSPNGFVIPSYSFGAVVANELLYCSNSGRHQVEMFTLNGEYVGFFGQPGAVAGRFCGCCNPVYLTKAANGAILTSEKGSPRISCYGKDGKFNAVMLNTDALGGGNKAYFVIMNDDRLYIAGRNTVSAYRYDENINKAACSGCNSACFKQG